MISWGGWIHQGGGTGIAISPAAQAVPRCRNGVSMTRTRLTALAAFILVVLSAAVFFTRRATGGVDAGPLGSSAWEVTVTVRGDFPPPQKGAKGAKAGPPRLVIYAPPDFRHQHVFDESWKSEELTRPEGRAPKGPREKGVWTPRPNAAPDKGYKLTY